jgi:hypothetical protein
MTPDALSVLFRRVDLLSPPISTEAAIANSWLAKLNFNASSCQNKVSELPLDRIFDDLPQFDQHLTQFTNWYER